MIQRILSCSFLAALLFAVPSLRAAASPPDPAIAARVGDDPVEVAEVQRMMDLVFHDKKPSGELLAMSQAQVLEEIVNRRLVIAYARRAGDLPGERELAKAKKQLQISLAAQGRKPPPSPRGGSAGDADLDRQALWRLTWDCYLAKYRTPQRRQAWFSATVATWTAPKWPLATSCCSPRGRMIPRKSKNSASVPPRSAGRLLPAQSTSRRPPRSTPPVLVASRAASSARSAHAPMDEAFFQGASPWRRAKSASPSSLRPAST